jgi:hypothetical protein
MGWIICLAIAFYLAVGLASAPSRYRRMCSRGADLDTFDEDFYASVAPWLVLIWPVYYLFSWPSQLVGWVMRREPRGERKAKLRQQAEEWRQREIEEIEDRLKAARAEIRMAERQRMRDWDKRFQEMDEGIERR